MAKNETRLQLIAAVEAAESKKAEKITILKLDKVSSGFTDYFLICSGTNPRQIQAIADEIDLRLSRMGQKPAHTEGYQQAEWVLLDYVDFVVHIFGEQSRNYYDLERLWKAAEKVTPRDLTAKAAARKAARKPVAKKASAKKMVRKAAKKHTPVRKATAKKPAAKKKTAKKTPKKRR